MVSSPLPLGKFDCLVVIIANFGYAFPTNPYPSRHLLVQSQQWKHQNNVWNLTKVNNKDTDVNDVVLVSLLLTLYKLYTLFWCFHCWLWTSKWSLGQILIISENRANTVLKLVAFHGHIKICEWNHYNWQAIKWMWR